MLGGWSAAQVGDWTGRRVVITGGNSGIGLEAAKVLVGAGASVVLACRDEAKGAAAAESISSGGGRGQATAAVLDLADLDSVRRFAATLGDHTGDGELDGFVANAGVMACPFATTAQGTELQMGTNHFGHALLTSLLLPTLRTGGRIVIVSSLAARGGNLTASMEEADLTAPAPYRPQQVYSNTKQANLLFAEELHRRAVAANLGITVVPVHPGVAATELFLRQLRDQHRGWLVPLARPTLHVILQPASAGALPTLRALSDPELHGGEFVGPRALGQSRGAPVVLPLYKQGADEAAAARLFELTESVLETSILPAPA